MKTMVRTALLAVLTLLFSRCSEDNTSVPAPTEPAAYLSASASKGGILYDTFFSTEAGFNQSDPDLVTFKTFSDFFRCKQCHAWDLLGTGGSYNNRAPKNNRPNVSSVNLFQIAKTKTAQELFDAMKRTTNRRAATADLSTYNPATFATLGDQMPDFSSILTDAQIWDLVKFMKAGATDVSLLYDATYTGTYPAGKATYSNLGKDGNAANGKTYYSANCAICHGVQGDTFLMENMTVGAFTRSKPNEVQHKVRFGQLGSVMVGKFDITLSQMKDLYKALADTVAFPK